MISISYYFHSNSIKKGKGQHAALLQTGRLSADKNKVVRVLRGRHSLGIRMLQARKQQLESRMRLRMLEIRHRELSLYMQNARCAQRLSPSSVCFTCLERWGPHTSRKKTSETFLETFVASEDSGVGGTRVDASSATPHLRTRALSVQAAMLAGVAYEGLLFTKMSRL